MLGVGQLQFERESVAGGINLLLHHREDGTVGTVNWRLGKNLGARLHVDPAVHGAGKHHLHLQRVEPHQL